MNKDPNNSQAQLVIRTLNTREGTSQPLQDEIHGLDPSGMTFQLSNSDDAGNLVARPCVSRVACASARPSGTTNSATVDAVESAVTPIFDRVRRSRASADCLAARPSVLSDNGGWRKNRVPRLKSTRLRPVPKGIEGKLVRVSSVTEFRYFCRYYEQLHL